MPKNASLEYIGKTNKLQLIIELTREGAQHTISLFSLTSSRRGPAICKKQPHKWTKKQPVETVNGKRKHNKDMGIIAPRVSLLVQMKINPKFENK